MESFTMSCAGLLSSAIRGKGRVGPALFCRSMASAIIPLGRPAQPEEAAGPVLFLCSEHANYVHGQILNVTGGQFGGMYT